MNTLIEFLLVKIPLLVVLPRSYDAQLDCSSDGRHLRRDGGSNVGPEPHDVGMKTVSLELREGTVRTPIVDVRSDSESCLASRLRPPRELVGGVLPQSDRISGRDVKSALRSWIASNYIRMLGTVVMRYRIVK